MSGHNWEADRNIREAEDGWDNDGVTFREGSNTHKLMRALLTIPDDEDHRLQQIRDSHHIDHATGKELDQIGKLVQVRRKQGEGDDKYRARIKVQFRIGNIGTSFDEFAEFVAVLLQTDVNNILYNHNYELKPATIEVYADPEHYNNVEMSRQEVAKYLSKAVPGGHDVDAYEYGTFRLKGDGENDTARNGLTSNSTDEGGRLTSDLL